MANVSIYVGTYKKYNEGSIFGQWFNLEDFSDYEELKQAMHELHKNEQDPEFMLQDYECPKLFEELGLISESHISENIFEVLEEIEQCNYDFEVIEAYCNCIGCYNDTITDVISKVEECYNGEYDSDIDFVSNLLEYCGDIPKDLPNYIHIDWEQTAWNVMLDYSTSDNHYFRNM